MKTFTVPTREQVSAKNQEIFDALNKALGFVPNLYATIAHSENGLERFLNYQNAKTSLSNKEKEAVNLIVSQVNGCAYCQSAHLVLGKMNGFTDQQLEDIRRGKSQFSKLNSLVQLAADITKNRGYASSEYVDAFLETIEDSLVNAAGVQFVGWGTFEVKRTKERKGRNPKTGEEITIQARKNVSFKAGAALKSKVNA